MQATHPAKLSAPGQAIQPILAVQASTAALTRHHNLPGSLLTSPDPCTTSQSLSCAGLMLLRPTAATTAFLAAWASALQADGAAWDQNVFNDLARQGADLSGSAGGDSRLWKGHRGALTVGILPVARFAGGHTFFVQSLYEVRGDSFQDMGAGWFGVHTCSMCRASMR